MLVFVKPICMDHTLFHIDTMTMIPCSYKEDENEKLNPINEGGIDIALVAAPTTNLIIISITQILLMMRMPMMMIIIQLERLLITQFRKLSNSVIFLRMK